MYKCNSGYTGTWRHLAVKFCIVWFIWWRHVWTYCVFYINKNSHTVTATISVADLLKLRFHFNPTQGPQNACTIYLFYHALLGYLNRTEPLFMLQVTPVQCQLWHHLWYYMVNIISIYANEQKHSPKPYTFYIWLNLYI